MAYALVGIGVVSLAYGVLMAVLYPAGGFFLVWLALGAALAAAVALAKRAENAGKRIAFIVPDTGMRYLSTGLFKE